MNNQTDIDLQEMIMNYEVIEMHYFVKHITSEGWLSAFSPQKPAFLKLGACFIWDAKIHMYSYVKTRRRHGASEIFSSTFDKIVIQPKSKPIRLRSRQNPPRTW